jgi:peptidoglycan/xylan/chitin deacetylase (PgdA/CDA1 family)
VKRLLLALVLLAGLAAPSPAAAYRGPVPILTYHQIRAAPHGDRSPASASLWMPASRFRAQMDGLARRGFHGVTLNQMWEAWHGGPALPAKPVVVSFDDGYASQYTNAEPVLARLGWPGVLNLEVSRIDVPGGLSSGVVQSLVGRGWELASHTLTHPDLTRVSAAELKREVVNSRVALERDYGVPIRFFCFPYGHSDAAARAAVRAAGYTAATTTRPRIASPRDGRFALPRITVSPHDTAAGLARRLRG